MVRIALAAVLASLCLATAAAAYPRPPQLPDTTHGAKRCGEVRRNGYAFRVFVVNHRIRCSTARAVVRHSIPVRGWTYFDWTKGGNGPWSDVYLRRDRHAVVAAIIDA